MCREQFAASATPRAHLPLFELVLFSELTYGTSGDRELSHRLIDCKTIFKPSVISFGPALDPVVPGDGNVDVARVN